MKLSIEERIEKYSRKNNKTKCLEWTGYKVCGYGSLRINGKKTYMHRFQWEKHFGKIPKGKFILHKCDNRKCFNIDHLFIGTQKDNIRDAVSKKRMNNQKKKKCPRGHFYDETNTYITKTKQGGESRTCRKCRVINVKKHQSKN